MGWTPGSGVGVSLWFTLLRRADVGLGVLAGFLHCAVVVVVVAAAAAGSGCGPC